MHTQERVVGALQFEIEVGGETYRSLVGGLRSMHASIVRVRSARRSVRAIVELDTTTQTFSINSLGGHRLPRPIGIRTGSETYRNVAHLISNSFTTEEREDLRDALRDILALTETPPLKSVHIHRDDFEVLANDRTWSEAVTSRFAPKRLVSANILLEIDDAPTLIVPTHEGQRIDTAVGQLRESLVVLAEPAAQVNGNFVEVMTTLSLCASVNSVVDLWIHWGSYEDLAPPWQQEQLTTIAGTGQSVQIPLYFRAHLSVHGWYGATFFAQVRGSSERIWIGGLGEFDARFYIDADDSSLIDELNERFVTTYDSATQLIAAAIESSSVSAETLEMASNLAPHVSLAGAMEQRISADSNQSVILQSLLSQAAQPGNECLHEILSSTYGIGEVVFATPEGPHAAAGGLAQVISGLPPELARAGIPVSIVSPLYRYENGNKHSSAEQMLQKGVVLEGSQIKPHYLGSISVDIGPTYTSGTSHIRRAPSSLPIKVYLAQRGRIRLFLLANNSAFDRLYHPVYADEQLRRGIILSRAVLETIATSHFGIRPSIIISNDWLTACVPSLFALDPRYQRIPWLTTCKTTHMIHNGGADYHGRLPCNINNEDLWPLLNLAPEHYFGFRDPHREDLLNLTMAAARHATGGVITVSKPYARELLSPLGGNGLEQILRERSQQLYGVSNGINRDQLYTHLSCETGVSVEELSRTDCILRAKSDARARVQLRFGLTVTPEATLVSFVGRLAEQKGLSLLSGIAVPSCHSTLEELLLRHTSMQLIVAGPPTSGDEASDELRATLLDLQRRYPGRVAASLEYVSHSNALEIMLASSLFLMPSRFEPGGITQLEALAMGTLVVGRNVGGISATIENYNEHTQTGTGFLCEEYSPTAFANTADWALTTIKNRDVYRGLVSRALTAKHCWSDRAALFLAVLQDISLGRLRSEQLTVTRRNRTLLQDATIC